jgi:hypothetical protein
VRPANCSPGTRADRGGEPLREISISCILGPAKNRLDRGPSEGYGRRRGDPINAQAERLSTLAPPAQRVHLWR